jgi:hypothetical protein
VGQLDLLALERREPGGVPVDRDGSFATATNDSPSPVARAPIPILRKRSRRGAGALDAERELGVRRRRHEQRGEHGRGDQAQCAQRI